MLPFLCNIPCLDRLPYTLCLILFSFSLLYPVTLLGVCSVITLGAIFAIVLSLIPVYIDNNAVSFSSKNEITKLYLSKQVGKYVTIISEWYLMQILA